MTYSSKYANIIDPPWEWHGEFIASLAKGTSCKIYIELGVLGGLTLGQVARVVDRAIGVDIVDQRYDDCPGEFFKGTTDLFFKTIGPNNIMMTYNMKPFESADIIFIDADHSFQQAKKDFENSLDILSEHGIIILHDTDPQGEDQLTPECSNDVYKIVDYIGVRYPELDIVTFPMTDTGMSLVTRSYDRRIFSHLRGER